MAQIVYWRRDLPPLSEQIEGEHELTADSERIHDAWVDRASLWGRCYPTLMAAAEARIAAEVSRLHGSCAHVIGEVVTSKADDGSGDFWLTGTFHYVLYVHPAA